MRRIDIGMNMFHPADCDEPHKSVRRAQVPKRRLQALLAAARPGHERLRRLTAFIIALLLLLVSLQVRAQASASCATGKTMCGARCVNLSIAPRNCGACGNVCGAGQTCSNGACTGTSSVNNNADDGADNGGKNSGGDSGNNNSSSNNGNNSGSSSSGTNSSITEGISSGISNGLSNGISNALSNAFNRGSSNSSNSGNNSNNSSNNNAYGNGNSNLTASCHAPKTMCGARCVNLSVAPRNCGACGNVCAAGQKCRGGQCSSTP
jgi:hypothetical protein